MKIKLAFSVFANSKTIKSSENETFGNKEITIYEYNQLGNSEYKTSRSFKVSQKDVSITDVKRFCISSVVLVLLFIINSVDHVFHL